MTTAAITDTVTAVARLSARGGSCTRKSRLPRLRGGSSDSKSEAFTSFATRADDPEHGASLDLAPAVAGSVLEADLRIAKAPSQIVKDRKWLAGRKFASQFSLSCHAFDKAHSPLLIPSH